MTRLTQLPDRRTLLGAGLLASFDLATPFGALLDGHRKRRVVRTDGYGELKRCFDRTTGLHLVDLPRGFSCRTFGWTGDSLTGGPTPSRHDGMGVVAVDAQGVATLVRNHEIGGAGSAFGPAPITYDAVGRGGTTRLRFDTTSGAWLSSELGLSGTSRNCAGGPTPWGSWLTCEETVTGPSEGFQETHGWIYEVPASGAAHPVALEAMGRFLHEAVCVDPATGFVYETEDDRYTSGFYRFRPNQPNALFGLEAGGQLEMLKVKGVTNADLMLVSPGDTFQVEWVPIATPGLDLQNGVGPFGSFDGMTTTASGTFLQGYQAGGARFRRLEGCWHDPGEEVIHFTDTEGGAPVQGNPTGSLFRYDPKTEQLRVVVASLPAHVLLRPDNLTVSPRGGVVMCEDNGQSGTRLIGLSRTGEVFTFARNAVVLNGQVNGFSGDYRGSEWCGACFDPTGEWLFVNIQSPGITLAITGPWESGPL